MWVLINSTTLILLGQVELLLGSYRFIALQGLTSTIHVIRITEFEVPLQ